MRFLHIIPPSKRMMDTYIRMLRDNFETDEHHFYFINECPDSEKSLFDYGNVQQMTGNSKVEKMKHLYKALKEADIVLWHGFIYPGRFMLFLAANPQFLKKSVWVVWGIDLYNWERQNDSLHNRVINMLNRYCRCHLKAVVTLLEPDRKYYQENFTSKIPCYVVPYPISKESFEAMDIYRDWKPRRNGVMYVQVAHNAHTFNNHMEILESLVPYAEENMRLFLPMSYGNDWHTSNDQYGKKIQDFVKEHFPKKARILERLMPQLKYTEFLWNMDVAIFNAERQNALGNILKLLYMGNKVYLTPNGPLYTFFKEKNIEIYSTKDIGKIPYSEFVTRSSNKNAIAWIRKTYHPELSKINWKKCFEDISGKPILFTHSETQESNFEQAPEVISPLYKPNYWCVMRYLKWNRVNLDRISNAVIVGAGIMGVQTAQWIFDSNDHRLQYFIRGFLDNTLDTFNGFVNDFDIIGTWRQWTCEPLDKLIFALDEPSERKEAVAQFTDLYREKLEALKFEETNGSSNTMEITDDDQEQSQEIILPVGEVIHPNASVSHFSKRGNGCLIGPNTIVDVGAELGDFVYINDAYIGSFAKIGSFCNIGANCYIGSHAVIDDGISLKSGTIIPDGRHVKTEGVTG